MEQYAQVFDVSILWEGVTAQSAVPPPVGSSGSTRRIVAIVSAREIEQQLRGGSSRVVVALAAGSSRLVSYRPLARYATRQPRQPHFSPRRALRSVIDVTIQKSGFKAARASLRAKIPVLQRRRCVARTAQTVLVRADLLTAI